MSSALLAPWSEALGVQDVSLHYHEVGIWTGYRRQNQPWTYYWKSLFHLHNETFNVWTHLVGSAILIIVWTNSMFGIHTETQSVTQLINIYVICSVMANSISALVHLLHSKSDFFHYCATLTDYIGVSTYPFATAMLQMYISADRRVYHVLDSYFIPLNVVLGWTTFIGISLAKLTLGHPSQRLKRKLLQASSTISYIMLLAAIVLPRYSACISEVVCDLSSLNHLSVVFVSIIVMGAMYSTLFPEKYCPGRFDIIGHSHQWFHVLGTLMQVLQLRAALTDINSGSMEIAYAVSKPNISSLLTSLVVLLSLDIVTLVSIVKFIISKKVRRKEQ